MASWSDMEVLITGGTGFLSKNIVKTLLKSNNLPKGIRLLSRNEENQRLFEKELELEGLNKKVSFLLGDLRDRYRIDMASYGVDIIIHTGAIKQIQIADRDPIECVQTNIIGTQNVIEAAIKNKVQKAMLISTDKCVRPSTLYGATKMVAENLFIKGNIYSGGRNPKFSCVRYGNVIGSTGSVIPIFKKQYEEKKELTITSERMSRFFITIDQAVNFVLSSIDNMRGGEIFVPKLPSINIMKIAEVIAPESKIKIIGMRQGEKEFEELIAKEESINVIEYENHYVITTKDQKHTPFQYDSLYNPWILTKDEIRKMVELC